MPELLKLLTPEVIASGLVGIIMAGVIARNVLLGYVEGRAKLKETEKSAGPFMAAMGIGWDRDQTELVLQTLVRIAQALELISKSQIDKFQQTTQSKLEDILDRMDQAEAESAKPKPRPRRRKPKSTA